MSATVADRALLEDQRDFLLRSIEDLEAERAAGDIDEGDFEALRADYTARAATVLRALKSLDSPSPPAADHVDAAGPAADPAVPAADPAPGPARRRWSRRRWVLASGGGVAILAVIAVVAITSSGSRLPSGVATGAAVGVERQAQLIAAAEADSTKGNNVGALEDYEAVLKSNPNQVTALTNEGWILAQTQQPQLLGQGISLLGRAEHDDPTYPPAHVYRGVAYLSEDDYADAIPELQWYLAHDPDPTLAPGVRTALATAQKAVAAGPAKAP